MAQDNTRQAGLAETIMAMENIEIRFAARQVDRLPKEIETKEQQLKQAKRSLAAAKREETRLEKLHKLDYEWGGASRHTTDVMLKLIDGYTPELDGEYQKARAREESVKRKIDKRDAMHPDIFKQQENNCQRKQELEEAIRSIGYEIGMMTTQLDNARKKIYDGDY